MEKKFLASGHYFSIKACWRLKKKAPKQAKVLFCFNKTIIL
jgi:hypothetical protein